MHAGAGRPCAVPCPPRRPRVPTRHVALHSLCQCGSHRIFRGGATNTRYAKIRRFSYSASTFRMPSFEPVSRQPRHCAAAAETDPRGGVRGSVVAAPAGPHRAAPPARRTRPSGQPNHELGLSPRSDRESQVVDAAASSARTRHSGRREAAHPACPVRAAHFPAFTFPPFSPVASRTASPAAPVRLGRVRRGRAAAARRADGTGHGGAGQRGARGAGRSLRHGSARAATRVCRAGGAHE
ncbi:Hypothetical protein bglu_1g29950 [Burkholderia glumae BGR1]|nr:Hypothetical protein bglu_1g29950 [Burkholderia glumae BGR1]